MKHSLLFTTVRPEQVVNVLTRWTRNATDNSRVQWCVTTDAAYADAVQAELDAAVRFLDIRDLRFDVVQRPPFSCNRAWNAAAKLADGDLLYMVPDDLYPPAHWDAAIESVLPEYRRGKEWVIHTDDGREDKPLTHPIVSRAWYERFGYFLYPNYRSMFDDTELAERAKEFGAVIDVRHLKFAHRHWWFGTRVKDAHDEIHAGPSRFDASKHLFEWRKARAWPEPSFLAPRAHSDYAAYLQVNRDDFCLLQTCEALRAQGVERFFFHFQMRGWNGEVATPAQFAEVDAVAGAMRSKGCEAVIERMYLAPVAGEQRILTETRVRQWALRSMRARGMKFILVVDGDEVWMPGALEKVHAIAREGWQVVASNAFTIAGSPGYVMETPRFRHNIYLGPDADLTWCRNTNIEAYPIEEKLLWHFTGVRRTFDEVVRKHLASGHGDDPEYPMEKWVKEKLPKIYPGMRNAHMWKDGSAWSEVRHFSRSEFSQIPKNLRKYLGKPPL
jgi:hypothetical protein